MRCSSESTNSVTSSNHRIKIRKRVPCTLLRLKAREERAITASSKKRFLPLATVATHFRQQLFSAAAIGVGSGLQTIARILLRSSLLALRFRSRTSEFYPWLIGLITSRSVFAITVVRYSVLLLQILNLRVDTFLHFFTVNMQNRLDTNTSFRISSV